jgi:C1A family cysteine protease
MIYAVKVVAASLLVAQTLGAPVEDYSAKFVAWKATHAKSYSSAALEAKAFDAFSKNEDKITAHNVKGLNYQLGHNQFSDLTAEEFFAQKTGYSKANTNRNTYSRRVHPAPTTEELGTIASSVDWVSAGAVTPVKDQGQCGSCWSFSATGAMEGAYFKSQGSLVSLSEEDLVQCNSVTDSGCNGGLMDNAFAWVETNGIASESAYPYTSGSGTTGTCDSSKKANPVARISGYTDVASNSHSALQSAVAQQPVSIAIEADQSVFQLYSGGVMDSASCGTSLDHGVLVVGYDTTGSSPYWKVKNSWGSSWGEDGYIRLGMSTSGSGICGMYTEPSYPTGATPA